MDTRNIMKILKHKYAFIYVAKKVHDKSGHEPCVSITSADWSELHMTHVCFDLYILSRYR